MCHKIAVSALLLIAGNVCAEEAYSAKALFFAQDDTVQVAKTNVKNVSAINVANSGVKQKNPTEKVTINKGPRIVNFGASYFVRLKGKDGGYKDVLASQKFKTGDRFQLGVKVNKPSYVYILNEDAAGVVTKIYPQPGQDNYIDAMGTVFFPSRGSFQFEGKPGAEQLLVYLSSTPIKDHGEGVASRGKPDVVSQPGRSYQASAAEICNSASGSNMQLAIAAELYASKGVRYQEEAKPCSSVMSEISADYASKGIVFSTDPEPGVGGQVASYVVKQTTQNDKNLFLKIKLMHE